MSVGKLIVILFGLLYLIGAIFNFLYTLRHGNEFYGSFADKALLALSRRFVRNVVIPQALLIAFQLLVALSLLTSGGLVKYGLIAGAVFCFSAAFVSNISGAAANLSMALTQIYLAIAS
jgi:uncharacterized membrane protein